MGATGGHSLVSVNRALLPHSSDAAITQTVSFLTSTSLFVFLPPAGKIVCFVCQQVET